MMPRRGLTFVELLVAATIFAILAMGLSAHLRGGIDVWRRVTSTTASAQRRRVIADRLRSDLANSVFISIDKMAVAPSLGVFPVFQKDKLAFVTAAPPQTGETTRRLLRVVRYKVNGAELQRTECAFQEAMADSCADTHVKSPPLAEGVKDFELQYAYLSAQGSPPALEWHDTWDDKKNLPRLIEVHLSFGTGSVQRLDRRIVVPQGQLETLQEAQQTQSAQQAPASGSGGPPPPPPAPAIPNASPT